MNTHVVFREHDRIYNAGKRAVLTLTLPFPPSINKYYFRSSTGNVFISRKGNEYRKKIKLVVSKMQNDVFKTLQQGSLAMHVIKNCPLEQFVKGNEQDIDNGNKALLDALTHAHVWADDSQVKTQLTQIGEPIEGGSVTVLIAHLADVSVSFDIAR